MNVNAKQLGAQLRTTLKPLRLDDSDIEEMVTRIVKATDEMRRDGLVRNTVSASRKQQRKQIANTASPICQRIIEDVVQRAFARRASPQP